MGLKIIFGLERDSPVLFRPFVVSKVLFASTHPCRPLVRASQGELTVERFSLIVEKNLKRILKES